MKFIRQFWLGLMYLKILKRIFKSAGTSFSTRHLVENSIEADIYSIELSLLHFIFSLVKKLTLMVCFKKDTVENSKV